VEDRPHRPRFGITWALVPTAIQLRYLQTVTKIASEKNSTTIFPIRIDLSKACSTTSASAATVTVPALPARGSGKALPPVPDKDKVPASTWREPLGAPSVWFLVTVVNAANCDAARR
jgi:hypothetical protein